MINGTEKILVCCGTSCIANGALDVAAAIEAELAARGMADDVATMSYAPAARANASKAR